MRPRTSRGVKRPDPVGDTTRCAGFLAAARPRQQRPIRPDAFERRGHGRVLELLVYPAINEVWRWREVRLPPEFTSS